MLCDGTDATINYTVGDDGSIVDVTASPEGAEIKTDEHGVKRPLRYRRVGAHQRA